MRASSETSATQAALSLLDAEAVRARARRMLDLGLADRLPHFRVHLDRLDAAAEIVLAVTRKAYPSLEVPFHSRWRHFVVGGVDRWALLDAGTAWKNRAARARAAFDLAIVSVLLDAGAGPEWSYEDALTGARVGRSEGLALASFDMFADGAFAHHIADPLRADADTLRALSTDDLAHGLQVSRENPLVGLEGRAALLRRLGAVVAAAPDIFARAADTPRPGGLYDLLVAEARDGRIAAPAILTAVLRHLGPIWPSRLTLGGIPLGDCWEHPALAGHMDLDGDAGACASSPSPACGGGVGRGRRLLGARDEGPLPDPPPLAGEGTQRRAPGQGPADVDPATLVPLHKLSQWLTYSLIEPLQAAGIAVDHIDGLTGLAEYRNGGLFLDTGVLTLRDPEAAHRTHDVSAPLVVEWRALTVALLDLVAERMRARLELDATAFPLAKVLEGGTWAAGRQLARERRPDGSPPLRVVSDGTVF